MILKKRGITTMIGTALLCFISLAELNAQRSIGKGVGIGTVEPDESAILEISSTTRGLLLPRMTLNQRASIIQPAAGLVVYQTDLLDGLYIYNGKNWNLLALGTAVNLTANATTWSTSGNEVLGTENFLGTLDDAPLIFKVNNEFSGLLDSKQSNTFLGYKTGWATKSFNSVVIGAFALQRASTGNDNVVVGFQSLFSLENGQYNVAVGSLSLSSSIIGDKNTVIGAMAGYRAKGSSNVFVGFQAGYFEQGNDKLYINNNASQTPLIYGDFKEQMVGINTSEPANKLSIKGNKDGESGLQLQSLTSASRATASNGKALSVDNLGNVILVLSAESGTNTSTGTSNIFWQERGNGIQNQNEGDVLIRKNINVTETVKGNRLEVANGGIVFKNMNASTTPLNPNGKSLSLDNSGNVILVRNEPVKVETNWQAAGNDLTNGNSGTVFIRKNLEVSSGVSATNLTIKTGKIKFDNLSSNSPSGASNGKVLTLDSDGSVILTNEPVKVETNWQTVGNDLTNGNSGTVFIRKNLEVSSGVSATNLTIKTGKIKFDNLSSSSLPSASNGKVLTLDSDGNVILTNDGIGNTDPGQWKKTENRVELKQNSQVVIGDGITQFPDAYNLFVSKGILAEHVRVAVPNSASWADYVFKPDYRLMPLHEIEKFITTYGHLPKMYSAKEVVKRGVDVLEMSVKLLEKVEELTLYAIDADKRIKLLEQRLDRLEK
jgi:hypothetical protein